MRKEGRSKEGRGKELGGNEEFLLTIVNQLMKP